MTQIARQLFDFHEYVSLEEGSTVRHEFLGGQVWAMAGGSPEHARIAANVAAQLSQQLESRRCAVFSSDLRVRVKATGLATYPDVSVVCAQLEFDPDDPKKHTVLNPSLVVEVLSPSTAEYDRGEKLEHYRQIPSLQEIVLVSHVKQELEVWRRTADGWHGETVGAGSAAMLGSSGCTLPVSKVYHDPLS